MKKCYAIVIFIAAMFTFVGCGSDNHVNAPVVTVTASPTNNVDSQYLSVVRAEYPQLNSVQDQTILDYAHGVCTMFDNGATLADVADVAQQAGMPMDVAGYMAGAAVAAYCPQYSNLIDNSQAS